MPAWQGELLRLLYRFPRLALPGLALLGRFGTWRRIRWRRTGA